MIGITFALPVESVLLARRLEKKCVETKGGFETIRGSIGTIEIEIAHTGVGPTACRKAVNEFLTTRELEALVSSGFAGGVRENLDQGDLVVAKNFSEPRLLAAALSQLPASTVHVIKLFSAAKIIDAPSERMAAAAANDAEAIDMETETIAVACAERGIPLLSLRVISDSLRAPLPAPPQVLFDIEKQRTNFLALTKYVLNRPSAIGRLIAFQRELSNGRSVLTEALVRLLHSGRILDD